MPNGHCPSEGSPLPLVDWVYSQRLPSGMLIKILESTIRPKSVTGNQAGRKLKHEFSRADIGGSSKAIGKELNEVHRVNQRVGKRLVKYREESWSRSRTISNDSKFESQNETVCVTICNSQAVWVTPCDFQWEAKIYPLDSIRRQTRSSKATFYNIN